MDVCSLGMMSNIMYLNKKKKKEEEEIKEPSIEEMETQRCKQEMILEHTRQYVGSVKIWLLWLLVSGNRSLIPDK